jgi:predicted 2-oxoglutarate/Fe(II)-dependent dioxygenase YbiX
MARIRTLRRFDYLPDFVCQSACRTLHTASLAGRRWILVAMSAGSPAPQPHPGSPRACATEHVMRVVYAMVGPESAASTPADRDDVYVVGDDRVARLLFGDRDARNSACCLLVDRDQKILHRVDCVAADLPGVVDGVVALSLRAPDRAETKMIPVLHIPHALDDDVCDRLVEHHRLSSHKVQGRVGLSAPHLDLTLKRRVHVNVDPELGTAIDEHLIFALLPAIERVFDYRVTHRVAYKISSYAAADSGFFTTHRDNSDPGTLFRRFALSLALNDEWSGGGICFPEYSSRPFQLPKGDAMVFPASLLHRVEPILEGERFVLLSFFYDIEGALARRAAMGNPEVLEGTYKDSISADLVAAYEQYAPLSRFSPQYALTEEP